MERHPVDEGIHQALVKMSLFNQQALGDVRKLKELWPEYDHSIIPDYLLTAEEKDEQAINKMNKQRAELYAAYGITEASDE